MFTTRDTIHSYETEMMSISTTNKENLDVYLELVNILHKINSPLYDSYSNILIDIYRSIEKSKDYVNIFVEREFDDDNNLCHNFTEKDISKIINIMQPSTNNLYSVLAQINYKHYDIYHKGIKEIIVKIKKTFDSYDLNYFTTKQGYNEWLDRTELVIIHKEFHAKELFFRSSTAISLSGIKNHENKNNAWFYPSNIIKGIKDIITDMGEVLDYTNISLHIENQSIQEFYP